MNFYIIAEGIGYGHISRSKKLYEELEKIGDVKIFTFGKAYKFAKELGMNVIEINFNFELKKDENGVNIEKNTVEYITSLKLTELGKLVAMMKKDKVKHVFVDSNALGIIASKIYGNANIHLISNNTDLSIFTDKFMLSKSAEALSRFMLKNVNNVFVPDFPPPYCISWYNLNFFGMEEKFKFIGPMVEEIKNRGRKYRLLSYGGVGEKNTFFEKLDGVFYSTTIKGRNIKKIPKSKYHHYFGMASLIITHGGHSTIMEAIKAGKPMLIIYDPTYGEQRNNAKRVMEMNLGISIDKRFLDKRIVEHAINEAEKLSSKVKKIQKMAKNFNGAKEIISTIGL